MNELLLHDKHDGFSALMCGQLTLDSSGVTHSTFTADLLTVKHCCLFLSVLMCANAKYCVLSYVLKNYGKKKEMKLFAAKEYGLEKMTTWSMNSLLLM